MIKPFRLSITFEPFMVPLRVPHPLADLPTHTHACATVLLIGLNEPGWQKIAPTRSRENFATEPCIPLTKTKGGSHSVTLNAASAFGFQRAG
jgi:hypothetical protein